MRSRNTAQQTAYLVGRHRKVPVSSAAVRGKCGCIETRGTVGYVTSRMPRIVRYSWPSSVVPRRMLLGFQVKSSACLQLITCRSLSQSSRGLSYHGAGSTRNLVTVTFLYQQQQPHGSTASCPSVHPSVPMSSRKCRPTQQEDENNFRDQQLPRKFRTTRQNGVFFRTKGQSYNASRSGGLCVPARSINNQITVAIVATPSDSIIFLPVLSDPHLHFPFSFLRPLIFYPMSDRSQTVRNRHATSRNDFRRHILTYRTV